MEWLALAAVTTLALAAFVSLSDLPLHNPDFAVFWGAARSGGEAYDRLVVESQLVGLAAPTARPFAYPPTFLVLIQPLRLLSYPVGYVAWVVLSALAVANAGRMAIAASRFPERARPRYAALLLLSPCVVQAGLIGQTTLFLAAAIYGGLCVLHRPRVAGVLFGLALCVKPQLGLLLPLGLAAGGHWRVLLVMVGAGLVVCLASLVAYGPSIWLEWLRALPGFLALNDRELSDRQLLHLPTWAKVVALLAGAALTWRAFRGRDPAEQMVAAVGTALLLAPHAMWYEPAVLTPAALALLLKPDWRKAPGGAFLALPLSAWSLGIALTTVIGPLRARPPASPRCAKSTDQNGGGSGAS